MMGDTVIRVDGVSKKFCKRLRHSMYHGAMDVTRGMLGLESRTDLLRRGEFWAVQDVSFELKRGESMGLIGPNGSGKSTLLRLINGIYPPDKGRIEIRGRVGALIAVGAGFHPLMTGRENIYLNGAIMGMGRKEVDRKFDAIVDFADIEDFLDAPVKTYSSGMYVRLGFAVAIHCEPDILLVDEVLAVGDARFHKKCFEKMNSLKEDGHTMILVSHSLDIMRTFPTRSILLDQSRFQYDGAPDGAVLKYLQLLFPDSSGQETRVQDMPARDGGRTVDDGGYCLEIIPSRKTADQSFGLGGAWIDWIKVFGLQKPNIFCGGETLEIMASVSWDKSAIKALLRQHGYDRNLIMGMTIENGRGLVLTSFNTAISETREADIDPLEGTTSVVSFKVELPRLYEGDYFISPAVALGRQEHFTPLRRYCNIAHLYCSPREKHIFGLMSWPVITRKVRPGEAALPAEGMGPQGGI